MKHLKLFLLFTSIISLASCKRDPIKCPEDTSYNYNLAEIEKAKIAYTGKDTLVFLSDAGDTATLIGQGKWQGYEPDYESTRGGAMVYDCYEYIDIYFKGNHSELDNLHLSLNMSQSPSPYMSYLDIDVLEKKCYGRPYIINDENNYNDSITYSGKTTYGINIGKPNTDSIYILYNYHYGVLRVNQINSKTWTLIKKI